MNVRLILDVTLASHHTREDAETLALRFFEWFMSQNCDVDDDPFPEIVGINTYDIEYP